jgi:hypothetical protein
MNDSNDPHRLRVRAWVLANHGVFSRLSRELGVSVAFVQRIAYGLQDYGSKDQRVERRLRALGCPLKQKVA